ncbi:MAG: hypothetical protein NVS3B5_13830 [Sphingomicrobium sp.]
MTDGIGVWGNNDPAALVIDPPRDADYATQCSTSNVAVLRQLLLVQFPELH